MANSDRQTDPRAATSWGSGPPTSPPSGGPKLPPPQRGSCLYTAAGGGRERLFSLRKARKDRSGWTSYSRVQTPSPKAQLLLPRAPRRHSLNGEPRACACAARLARGGSSLSRRRVVREARFPSFSAARTRVERFPEGVRRPGPRRGEAERSLASQGGGGG